MQHSIQLPNARKDNLIIKELDGETLVYDRKNDQAHCLNTTAAHVWRLCDGQRTVSEIAQCLANQIETEADESLVWLALDQLQKFDLLNEAPTAPAHLAGMSRRQWVRNVGLATIALPVIISIAAPTAQAQASACSGASRPDGCACTSTSQCQPGHHCTLSVCGP